MRYFLLKRLVLFSIFSELCTPFIIGQSIWYRLDNEKSFIAEDIAITAGGKMYAGVFGRNIILESDDQGLSWNNICKSDDLIVPYYSEQHFKSLFVDHKGYLIEFLQDNGFIFPRLFNGDRFEDDPLSKQFQAKIGNKIIFDRNGNYYFIDFKKLNKYINTYFNSTIIFNKNERIFDAFMYDESHNYVVTFIENGTTRVYKLNSLTLQTQLLLNKYHEGSYIAGTVVSDSGTIWIASNFGLHRYGNEGLDYELVRIDSLLDPESPISLIQQTLSGHMLVKSGQLFYYSTDDGENWSRLHFFEKGFPEGSEVKKLIVRDSSNAMIIVEQDCDRKITMTLTPQSNGWKTLSGEVSSLKLSHLNKTSQSRIYAFQEVNCRLAYSDDESQSWHRAAINGLGLYQVFEFGDSLLYGITIDRFELFQSEDHGSNWEPVPGSNFGFPGLSFIGVKHDIGSPYFLISGFRDSITGGFTKLLAFYSLDGAFWELLSDSTTLMVGKALVFDTGRKWIYAYNPWQESQVYVSKDWGKSFQPDARFDAFGKIYAIATNDAGHLYVNGFQQGKLDLYVSKDQVNFEPYPLGFFSNKIIPTIKKLRYNHLAAISGIEGAFLSEDGGEHWDNISSGLGLDRNEIFIVKDIYVDRNNHGYISLEYDGLYKSIKPLINTKNENILASLILYPNPAGIQVTIECKSCNTTGLVDFEISDLLGRTVLRSKFTFPETSIELPNEMAVGLYTYLISDGQNKITGKLVKK